MGKGEMMKEARDTQLAFVCCSNDWGGHPASLLHVFALIAREYPVIWINSIGQRTPQFTRRDVGRVFRKLRAMGARRQTRENADAGKPLAVVEPRILPLHRYPWVRHFNGFALARQVRPLIARLIPPDRTLIFVTSNPIAVDLVGRFGEAASVYFCMDEYAEMQDSDGDIIRACEPRMLAAADCTFTTSRYLCERKTGPGYATRYLPQGVDYDHFQYRGPCPAPLADLPRPIIGFQGILGNRIDLRLLEKVATRFPQASLVTVGRCETDIGRLRRHRNYHHFDAVPYAQLPAWASQFDVGLIAYVRDGHASAVNPLKLLEYLAMGQQVVSVDLPELRRFDGYVRVADDHETYLEEIARLLRAYPFDEATRERQRQAAREESWRARAAEFVAVCGEIAASKRSETIVRGAAYAK